MEGKLSNISNLLGKPVISVYDGKIEGYIKNILTDKKISKLVWLCVFDDESQEEKLVGFCDIYHHDKDAVMIKNSDNVLLFDTVILEEINPIGYKVFDVEGKSCGKVLDLTFKENYYIEKLMLQSDQYLERKDILNIGDNLILTKGEKAVKISSFKTKTRVLTSIAKEVKVEIQNSNTKPAKTQPKKFLTAGFEFLIGRKVGQNIYADNKQLIAKKNSKITNQIIDTASKNGKLKELTTLSVI